MSGRPLPNVANAFAGNPSDKLVLEFTVQKVPHRLTVGIRHLRRTIVDEDGERTLRIPQITQKGTAFFQILRQVVDVDHEHDKLGTKNRNIASALILLHKLIDRLGVERIERTVYRRLVVKTPEIRRNIPRHHKVAAGNIWSLPNSRSFTGKIRIDQRSE